MIYSDIATAMLIIAAMTAATGVGAIVLGVLLAKLIEKFD